MNTVTCWSRVLMVAGVAGMLIGAIDPLEGSIIILPGSALVALGAFLGKSRYRIVCYWSLILVAVGVVELWVLSGFGGIGGSRERSVWWGLVVLPYPVGWILGLAGVILESPISLHFLCGREKNCNKSRLAAVEAADALVMNESRTRAICIARGFRRVLSRRLDRSWFIRGLVGRAE